MHQLLHLDQDMILNFDKFSFFEISQAFDANIVTFKSYIYQYEISDIKF